MNYQTYEVPEELKPFVNCFWVLQAEAADLENSTQRIIPDGCIEMIFHLGDLYEQIPLNGKAFIQPRCFVFGQITRALEIRAIGKTDIFSVRFQPEGFAPFIDKPLAEMADKPTELSLLFGIQGNVLADSILAAESTEERIKLISDFLISKVNVRSMAHQLSTECVQLILELGGQINVNELSDSLNKHRRQLERSLADNVGLSPKQLAKMIRMQACLRRILLEKDGSLSETAYSADYYDQAHFIKDFKLFTGQSPKNYFKSELAMTSLFIKADT